MKQLDEKTQEALQKVMVITVKKSFWASRECEVFPVRVYARKIHGYSQNLVNSLLTAGYGLAAVLKKQPKLIFFGSSGRLVPWFLRLKQFGLLKDMKMIATNQSYFSDRLARYVDRIIVYSHSEIEAHDPELHDKYVFTPLPADGDFDSLKDIRPSGYVFSGGGAGRDFETLIDAFQGLEAPLRIVTFSRKNLNYRSRFPANVTVEYRMPVQSFLERIAASLFVVVPLKKGNWPHGHTTIVQSLRLGKPVITSKNATTEDYVIHGKNGLLVEPGDTEGLRNAVLKLYRDRELLASLSRNAKASSMDFSYSHFAEDVVRLCIEVLG